MNPVDENKVIKVDDLHMNTNEVNDLIVEYDIGCLLDINVIDGGAANSSFILETTKGRFVLTVCDEKKFKDVENLVSLLYLLERECFPTTRIIQQGNGKSILKYNNKPTIIKRFIDGDVCQELDSYMLNQLGESLARLHKIPVPDYLPEIFPYGLEYFSEVFSLKSDQNFLIWLKEKQKQLVRQFSPDLPRGLIHGDVFYDNVLFDQGQLTAIIDFEEACNYYKVFDLGMCIVGTCSSKEKISLSKTKSLIEGYQSIRQLEEQEKTSLQTFIEYGAVATSFWRFRQYNVISPDESKSGRFLEMKLLADNTHSIPNDEFSRVF